MIEHESLRPRRVHVLGDLFHGRVPAGALYVGRAAPGLPASPYANPFPVKTYGLQGAMRMFLQYVDDNPELVERARAELAGHDLACWCPLPMPGKVDLCHGHVWVRVANPTRRELLDELTHLSIELGTYDQPYPAPPSGR